MKESNNKIKIVSPLAASRLDETKEEFYTAYPLREWGLVKKIRQMSKHNICGELCSLRFTWQRPKKAASSGDVFIYETLAGLLDAAWLLADAPLTIFHVDRVPGKNNLFALAMFENEVAAEFELNERLPDSMPETYFITANFKHGHITNRPIVGHFNEEGSILANDSEMRQQVIENPDWDDNVNEIRTCERVMMHAIEQGKFPAGALHSREIINAIKEAV